MKGWIRSRSVLIHWINSEHFIKWPPSRETLWLWNRRGHHSHTRRNNNLCREGLWGSGGQKVKTGGLTFMFHKMGSRLCNYDLRFYSDLEFPKETSPTSWFHLLPSQQPRVGGTSSITASIGRRGTRSYEDWVTSLRQTELRAVISCREMHDIWT